MNDKKFYWIKLKTDFFNQDTIDFLLSQKNGCEYIVLYQMLCLKTANNGGKLTTNIGEIIIPYDVEKIVRDCKYFDIDTVTVALELFKKLNLIYQEEDKILKITDFEEMVGSECSSAKRVREWREKKKLLQCNTNVTQEIEIRDKSIDININKKEILKKKYGEFENVLLTDEEYHKLEKSNLLPYIERLSGYIASRGKKYKSHYATILNWSRKDKPSKKTLEEIMGEIK